MERSTTHSCDVGGGGGRGGPAVAMMDKLSSKQRYKGQGAILSTFGALGNHVMPMVYTLLHGLGV